MSSHDGVSPPLSGPSDLDALNSNQPPKAAKEDPSQVPSNRNFTLSRQAYAMIGGDVGHDDDQRPANGQTDGDAQEACVLLTKTDSLISGVETENLTSKESHAGPTVPILNCPHVRCHVLLQNEQLPASINASCTLCLPNSEDSDCAVNNDGDAAQNLLCLQCGLVGCSQANENAHGLAHYKDTLESDPGEDKAGHCIFADLLDLSVWCHACQAYLNDPIVEELTEKLKCSCREELQISEHDIEGQEESSSDSESESSQDDPITAHSVRQLMPSLLGDDDNLEYPFDQPPRSLSDVAKYILSDKCQSIAILAGAGMSVASGIPDFRSAGGLYDTLRPGLLTATLEEREAIRADPTFALDMTLFLQNPLPCLELNRPFILGTRDNLWKATLAHRFVELLHKKTGKLTRLYQQNIDGLEGP